MQNNYETKCYCGHTAYCDCGPQDTKQAIIPKEEHKSNKLRNYFEVLNNTPEEVKKEVSDMLDGLELKQETHPFSEDDMIEFNEVSGVKYYDYEAVWVTTKELLQLWKDQQIKTINYE